MQRRFHFWVVGALLSAGCAYDQYVIEIRPEEDALHRKLTCWRQDDKSVGSFDADRLREIAAIYHQATPMSAAGKHSFERPFRGRMPADVGGWGSHVHWKSQMGSVGAYVERFRGTDDLMAGIEQRSKLADKLTDFLIGWLRSEFGDDERFEKLHRFLDEKFRRDARNMAVSFLMFEVAPGGSGPDDSERVFRDWLVRNGQYLLERGYFTPESMPALTRAAGSPGDPDVLLEHLRSFLAMTMGIADVGESSAVLPFLQDEARAKQSLTRYIRSTEEFKESLRKWEEERKANPDEARPEPDPSMPYGLLIDAVFGPDFLGANDGHLDVKLASPVRPFWTNGTWEEENGQVVWSSPLPSAGRPALFLHAFWAVPDAEFQVAHFGKVVLVDASLAEYCLWWVGLSEAEAREWEAFLARLRSSENRREELKAFRFSTDPAAAAGEQQVPPSLADTPRRLLGEAMNSMP